LSVSEARAAEDAADLTNLREVKSINSFMPLEEAAGVKCAGGAELGQERSGGERLTRRRGGRGGGREKGNRRLET